MNLLPSHPRSLIPDPFSPLIPAPRSLIPGFTLIEMLIVIGIIAILAAVLLSSFGGAQESAKLAKCQSNLRNLGMAVSAYVMENDGNYPAAGANQSYSLETTTAWISWGENSGDTVSYLANDKAVTYALTNGVMWKAVGGSADVYRCPVHVKTCQEKVHRNPGWSYAMNGWFVSANMLDPELRSDRRLLFAEIPGVDTETLPKKYNVSAMPKLDLSDGSPTTDAILQYKSELTGKMVGDKGGNGGSRGAKAESIGFNHMRGKDMVAPVVFADGHTETLVLPKTKANAESLTAWLCDGYDISFRNGLYSYDENSVTHGN